MRSPNFDASIIPAHYEFLNKLRAAGQLEIAGPFTDKSGGAYIIKADNFDHAKSIAFTDPVHTSGSSNISIYEWNAT
ncbi:UNVERIFIED_CONTAM: hypothetical protein GTU68_060345 [Idotea baltica]|nr:hypothetical protein [Idotea baltica]